MNRNELILQFGHLREKEEMLTKNISSLEGRLTEILIAKHTLEELKKEEGGGDMLVPIGGGCFIEAELKPLNHVIINVGDGVSKETSVEDSVSKLDLHAENIKKTILQARESLAKVEQELAGLNEEIRNQQ